MEEKPGLQHPTMTPDRIEISQMLKACNLLSPSELPACHTEPNFQHSFGGMPEPNKPEDKFGVVPYAKRGN